MSLILKAFNLLVLMRVGQRNTQLTSLRTEETAAGHRNPSHHILTGNAFHQFGIRIHHVGSRRTQVAAPSQMVEQGPLHRQVAHRISACIEIQQAVEAHRLFRADKRTDRSKGLQSAASADPHHLQLTEFLFLHACIKVDIGQCIHLIHHNVDVVTADTGRSHRNPFSLIGTCYRIELTAGDVTFLGLEMRSHQRYPSRVTHQNHLICQLFGSYMQVKNRTVRINNQFGRRKILFHMSKFN